MKRYLKNHDNHNSHCTIPSKSTGKSTKPEEVKPTETNARILDWVRSNKKMEKDLQFDFDEIIENLQIAHGKQLQIYRRFLGRNGIINIPTHKIIVYDYEK